MSKIIAFDAETYYDNDVSAMSLGAWKYARHPQCDAYMISVSDGKETWAGEPKHFNFDMLKGATLLSHNASFDQEIYAANVEKGLWPKIDFADWHCTANMSAYLCNRRSLDEASDFLLGVQVSKAMRNYMKGKSWADAIADGKAEDLLAYARADAKLCFDLWDQHSHKWPEWERRLSKMTIEQGRQGVRIHVGRLEAAIQLMQKVLLEATDKLPWLHRGDPKAMAGSRPRLVEECRRCGIPPPPIKKHDPEDAEEWEIEWSPKMPWIKALKDIRKAKKALATLQMMKLRLRDDNTMAFSLKYAGAHTLRWSGDGGINFQNFAREPLFVDEQWRLIDDMARISELMDQFAKTPDEMPVPSVDMRGLLLPPEGKLLGSVDSSQIEPRVLNYLVGNTPLLEKIRSGFPIYEAHARDSMGWTGGSLKKENPKLYALAKARVLGLGYGCGWEKFIVVAKTLANIDITEDDEKVALSESLDGVIYTKKSVYDKKENSWTFTEEDCPPYVFIHNPRRLTQYNASTHTPQVQLPVYGANSKAIVRDFRESNPLITGMWRQMQDALENAAAKREDLAVQLPSGRFMTYRRVRMETRMVKDKETNPPTKKQVLTAEVDGRRKVFYGGLIVENITQAVARDVFAHNTLLALDAGINVMWTVHDEDVDALDSVEQGEQARKIMTTVPPWLEGCPLDAELVISDRYKK